MTTAPKQGEKHTMQRKAKGGKQVTYHWCPPHRDGKGLWVQHKKSECRLLKGGDNDKKKKDHEPTLVTNNAQEEGEDFP